VKITAGPVRSALVAMGVLVSLSVAACGGGGFDSGAKDGPKQQEGKASLQVLIQSSGDAETKAVTDAAQAWASKTGNTVKVLVAQDIAQQLAQGFAGGKPPDVFYVDGHRFADLAKAGSLYPYVDQFADADDLLPVLRKTFTYEGKEYCVPKDYSTLALQIRTDAWKKAGLSEADVPTTWEELQAVSTKLSAGKQAGLVIGDTRDRIGAFMVQSGGWVLAPDGKTATADIPANIKALEYVKSLLASGSVKYPSQVDAGWGGEAFGTGRAAMTIEGNWIRGAMRNDYPKVAYTVHELPQGPEGKGTLSFTQCWGVAAQSKQQKQSVELITALMTADQQLANAKAFGVMPSRASASAAYLKAFPDDAPFVAGGAYAQGPVNAPGMESVLKDYDSSLGQLAKGDPQKILGKLQDNTTAVLGK
jgi:multiple sugar transport system substrate-binding protein